MDSQNIRSIDSGAWAGKAIVLEAPAGQARRAYLGQWLGQAEERGAATWLLDCSRDSGGPWAGLNQLFLSLLPGIETRDPALLVRHDYELCIVLPLLQRSLSVRNPSLTDLSPDAERTRNYAADRAYRIVQGLVDLFAAWHERARPAALSIACDGFERAGAMVRLFFAELLRRRGSQIGLTLLITATPEAEASQARPFASALIGPIIRTDLPADPPVVLPSAELTRQAQALTEQVGQDMIDIEMHLPELIRLWSGSDQPRQAVYYQFTALSIFSTRGLYEDALFYGEPLRETIEREHADNVTLRLSTYLKLYNCYAGLGRSLQALDVSETALALSDNPRDRFVWCYLIAMVHARFLPKRDFEKAELYLDQGIQALAEADIPEHVRLFQTAFNRNGLALIRHLQKRPDQAIELCKSSFEMLNAHLAPHEHRLHRSVLLYNIAQVYDATRQYDQAISYYSAAMQMDPNYSEYYNERGSVYLKLERLAEAERDYRTAIELSPPYQEVWTNLGQCYLLMERMPEAIQAYSRALDLDPQQILPRVGRGQAHQALEQLDEALADYDAALALSPEQPMILANRAAIHYSGGRLSTALADLNQAIAQDPKLPELYQNRATALATLEQGEAALQDLHTYLQLCPDADDRVSVEQQIALLEAGRYDIAEVA